MYLSILIPTYNYNCTRLVEELVRQARGVKGLQYEIIVGDDGSTCREVVEANREINNLPGASYWELERNVGRSAIRNLLYERSKGQWLLFLDSDGMPATDNFLALYIDAVRDCDAGVVCGGVSHPAVMPSPAVALRWLHETTYSERATIEWRNEHPYQNFRSFNFLTDRANFSKILFDEAVRDYGYEDNLFGQRLREENISVRHIENPMENMDIEPNEVYLAKNEEALRTLAAHYDTMARLISIAQFVDKLDALHIGWLLSLVYTVSRRLLLRNLQGSSPRMWAFNLYRAGYLRALLNRRKG